MKTFKIYYQYRTLSNAYNNAFQSNYQFVKAETEEQAVECFKADFRLDAELNIIEVECYL